MKILCIGDIIGRHGRRVVKEALPALRERYAPDFIIANGENAAGGFGLTEAVVRELLGLGIDVLTSGNHVWDKREFRPHLAKAERVLRPANYPPGAPGRGRGVFASRGGVPVGVLNLEGRVFMSALDCPFRLADQLLPGLRDQARVVVVDFHAEATSEKVALARYLDGRTTLVFGTHTHVQTADERILAGGTAAITDVGMTGGHDSVIGMAGENALQRFLTALPARLTPEPGGLRLNAVLVRADENTGRTLAVLRLNVPLGGDWPDGSLLDRAQADGNWPG